MNDNTALVIVTVAAMFFGFISLLGMLALLLERILKIHGKGDKNGASVSVSTNSKEVGKSSDAPAS